MLRIIYTARNLKQSLYTMTYKNTPTTTIIQVIIFNLFYKRSIIPLRIVKPFYQA